MTTQGISRVTRDAAERLAREGTSSSTRVFTLPYGIDDKKSLFVAIREALPLDPPLIGDRNNWDALEDSLFSGLDSVSDSEVLIVWPDASELLHSSPNDFETIAVILEGLARLLDDPKVTNGPVKKVAIVLGGAWP